MKSTHIINYIKKQQLKFQSRFISSSTSPWSTSSLLIEKKSRFIGRAISIQSCNEIDRLINELKRNDDIIPKSTHNISAWRIGDKNLISQGSHDDGETSGGDRILSVIQRTGAFNVLVVVTRQYGGTPIGPTRFRMICQCTQEALENGGFLNDKQKKDDGGNNPKENKGKGKTKAKRK